MRKAIADAGGKIHRADPAALSLWCYAMGLGTGWIMQGGAIAAMKPLPEDAPPAVPSRDEL